MSTAESEDLRERLAATLSETGLSRQDSGGPAWVFGGFRLTFPAASSDAGVVLAWATADELSDGGPLGQRFELYRHVQETMNRVVGDIAARAGFHVEPFGEDGGHRVIGPLHVHSLPGADPSCAVCRALPRTPRFGAWLLEQSDRPDVVGELGRQLYEVLETERCAYATVADVEGWVDDVGGSPAILEALEDAVIEYFEVAR